MLILFTELCIKLHTLYTYLYTYIVFIIITLDTCNSLLTINDLQL